MGPADTVFFLFFASHIPITILFDSQAVFPREFYPSAILDFTANYAANFRDPIMTNQPLSPWVKSFIVCEVLFQFPFFFLAVKAILSQAAWIRIPGIVYGIHVATTVVPILAELLFNDYEKEGIVGPSTLSERLALVGIYFPYLLIPLLFAIKMAVSPYPPATAESKKAKRQ